ncbi:MAG: hypothetical protein HPY66_0369 [Firmicutes bacterium]|nr:hypothetical protein [Bacillota bacterium]
MGIYFKSIFKFIFYKFIQLFHIYDFIVIIVNTLKNYQFTNNNEKYMEIFALFFILCFFAFLLVKKKCITNRENRW